jgi:hypothetical protein
MPVGCAGQVEKPVAIEPSGRRLDVQLVRAIVVLGVFEIR